MKFRSIALIVTGLLTLSACTGGNGTPPDSTTTTTGNQAPTVSIRTTNNQALTNNAFVSPGGNLILVANDDQKVASLTYKLTKTNGESVALPNGGVVSSVSGINQIALPPLLTEGSYTLTAVATDNLGVSSAPAVVTFQIDATDPVFTSVTVNNQGVDSEPINTPNAAVLKAVATDNSGTVTLTLRDGKEVLDSRPNEINFDLSKTKAGVARQPGQHNFTLVATDASGRTVERTVSINIAQPSENGGPVEQTPKPVLKVVGEGPFSGNMAVNASANIGAASTLDKMVLVVTDSEGRSESYSTTETNQTFSVDTSRFVNGLLTMQLVVFTKSQLEGRSAEQTVEVRNINAPNISIVAPINGSSFNGPTLPVRITITKNTSSFSIVNNEVTVQLLDYRGSLKATRTLKTNDLANCAGNTASTLTCDTTFDMADGDAGLYTVRAFTTANVDLLGLKVLEANSRFTSTVENASAPANNIIIPIRVSGDGADIKVQPDANAKLPILNRRSAIMVQASDNDGLKYVQVRFLYPDGKPVNSYLLNRSLGGVSEVTAPVAPLELDGSEYIPDGLYILQMTTEDFLGNTNIQEIWVRVNRNIEGQRLSSSASYDGEPNLVSGQLRFASATWKLNEPLRRHSRVVALSYFRDPTNNVQLIGKDTWPTALPGQQMENTIGFNTVGTYWTTWMVQDLDTGVVESIKGPELSIQRNL